MKLQRLTALLALLPGWRCWRLCWQGCRRRERPRPAPAGQRRPANASRRAPPAAANPSGLPEVKASELPDEARRTLALIAQGGPYPYTRDDVTFGNFERILPRKSSGYYKEYTVPTPGESDRGARRIVAGKAGEKYYTPDHYNSFKFIIEGK